MALSIALSLALAGASAPAYVPVFDPAKLKPPVSGQPNLVMVLGTPHISGLPKDFDLASLDPLLAKLAAWHPTIITIEAVSGPQCAMFLRYPALYPDVYDSYCVDPAPAQKLLGVDMPGATTAIAKMLATWPAVPTAAQRRYLATLFMAGGEPASAAVQWLRLPPEERRAADGPDAAMVANLNQRLTRRNENYVVAAALAARLGLERVYAVDDHSSDAVNVSGGDDAAFAAVIRKLWDNPAAKARKEADKALEADLDGVGALAMYRAFNRVGAAKLAYDSDFGAALADTSPQGFGRRYVGAWETRNLRMVANIRAAIAEHPGSRTLAIVGASHKGYFESYLNQMHDVHLVDAETVLK